MNDIYNRKDEEFTVIGEVPESFKLNDPLYKEGFQSGSASRDAEIHRLQMALADTEQLELGTAEKCEQLREQVVLLRDVVVTAKGMIAHHDNIAILDKALEATEPKS